MTTRIISVSNQKGGTAKTTTAANLGAALAEHGKKILLIDFDPQGHLSLSYGIQPGKLERTIHNALFEQSTTIKNVTLETNVPGVDLVPANTDLNAAEILLMNELSREKVLLSALKPITKEGRYDYILIDCRPTLGLLTINALTASHQIIIPVECAYLAMQGLKELLDTVAKIKDNINPQLEILGILLTKYDARTSHSKEVVALARNAFKELVFNTLISMTVRFHEAPVEGKPILQYASDSSGAAAYRELALEVLKRNEKKS